MFTSAEFGPDNKYSARYGTANLLFSTHTGTKTACQLQRDVFFNLKIITERKKNGL